MMHTLDRKTRSAGAEDLLSERQQATGPMCHLSSIRHEAAMAPHNDDFDATTIARAEQLTRHAEIYVALYRPQLRG